jgi:hypothetical protein
MNSVAVFLWLRKCTKSAETSLSKLNPVFAIAVGRRVLFNYGALKVA